MDCDCNRFSQDLFNLSKDILIKGDGKPQWEIFENFCIKTKRRRSLRSFPYNTTFCSQKICSFLIRNVNKLRNMALSTLLVDLLTILYFEFCARRPVRRLCDASFSSDREILRVIGALQGLWSLDFMKLLLNFGFLSSLPTDSVHLMEALHHQFAAFISGVAGRIPNNITIFDVREKAMESLTKGDFYHIKKKENCRRMFLVTMALRGVQISLQRNNHPVIEQFIGCLRMYFSATQDSLISVFEVRSILYASFLFINKLHLFDMCCQEFDKLMPECPAKIEPRKLTHLARCQIRQSLNESHLPLPLAVDKLLLPKILKSFLLGEVFDISTNRKNVSSQKSAIQSELILSGQ